MFLGTSNQKHVHLPQPVFETVKPIPLEAPVTKMFFVLFVEKVSVFIHSILPK
jgi:hypothetical protein